MTAAVLLESKKSNLKTCFSWSEKQYMTSRSTHHRSFKNHLICTLREIPGKKPTAIISSQIFI